MNGAPFPTGSRAQACYRTLWGNEGADVLRGGADGDFLMDKNRIRGLLGRTSEFVIAKSAAIKSREGCGEGGQPYLGRSAPCPGRFQKVHWSTNI